MMRGSRAGAQPARAANPRPTRSVVVPLLDQPLCAGHPRPWLWDDTVDGETRQDRDRRRGEAARICARCPEQAGCTIRVEPTRATTRITPRRPGVALGARECPECRTRFMPRTARQRFCGTRKPRCRDAHRNRAHATDLRRRRAGQGAPAPARYCPCGAMLTAAQQRRRIRYHSDECRECAARLRALPPEARVWPDPAPPPAPPDRQAVLAVLHGEAPLRSLPKEHRWIPVRSLRGQGVPVSAIARQLHCSRQTVYDLFEQPESVTG